MNEPCSEIQYDGPCLLSLTNLETLRDDLPDSDEEWYFYSDSDEYGGYDTAFDALKGAYRLMVSQIEHYGTTFGFIGPYQGKGNG
jgi:hypothetical protein